MSGPITTTQTASTADAARRTAELSARFGEAIRRYFSRRLGASSEVEDLTQEVFTRLLKRARLEDIDNVEGYLFQIAANLLRERSRQRIRRHSDAQQPIDEDFAEQYEELSPERIIIGRQTYALMIRAMQELPARARTIFILNRYEQLSGAEIARRLGVSVSTVEKDMMRAIAHLRQRLR